MGWRKRDLWKAGTVVGGVLLLVLMTLIVVSVADAHEGVSGAATPTPTTVQATPTEDATVAVLNKEKLQHDNDWLWSNGATILSSVLSTLVVVSGALIGFGQWRTNRKDTLTRESNDRQEAQDKELKDRKDARQKELEAQDKELRDRQAEREKRTEEQFQKVVEALGSQAPGASAGAAIMLRTFLQQDKSYEKFYRQVFDLAVTYLRLRPVTNPQKLDPPDSLSQALIVVFKEAVPRVREELERNKTPIKDYSKILDASRAHLDGASLDSIDLSYVYLREASFIGAHLDKANLTGAQLMGADFTQADLYGVNFTGAYLWRTHPENALSLEDADLRNVEGLSQPQLTACKAMKAIV